MNATPKKRLCWNCHGEVPMVVQTCPYCGVYIEQSASERQEKEGYEPPYSFGENTEPSIPASPFGSNYEPPPSPPLSLANPEDAAIVLKDVKSVMLPVTFLLTGSVFFLFGLVIALFSEEGVFTLSWNGEYWFAYLFGGIACLLFGWRTLQGLEEAV